MSIGYFATKFRLHLGIGKGDRKVDGWMTASIRGVMRQSAICKSQFVEIPALFNEAADEVASSNVVDKIAKQLAAKGIVSEVLNDATPIGIAVCDP